MHWLTLDREFFGHHASHGNWGVLRLSEKREAALQQPSEAGGEEQSLQLERRRWQKILEADASSFTTTPARKSYAKKKMQGSEWQMKVHAASVLLMVARAIVADDDAQSLFVQRFGEAVKPHAAP